MPSEFPPRQSPAHTTKSTPDAALHRSSNRLLDQSGHSAREAVTQRFSTHSEALTHTHSPLLRGQLPSVSVTCVTAHVHGKEAGDFEAGRKHGGDACNNPTTNASRKSSCATSDTARKGARRAQRLVAAP